MFMVEVLERLNIAELKAFVLVYEHGSFATVARLHGKHATTYGRRVTNLELDLGLDLFERRGSHIIPTEDGKSLYFSVKAILTEVELFGQRVQQCFTTQESHVRLAIDTSLKCFVPYQAVAKITELFPATEVDILTGNTEQVINLVANEEVDVALSLTAFKYPPTINNNKLFDFGFVRVMSPKYAKMHGLTPNKPVEVSVIRSLKQIVMSTLNKLGVSTQNYSNHLLNVDSFETAKALAIDGIGWCNLPLAECRNAIATGQLMLFEVEHDHLLEWSVDALWPMEPARGHVAKQFVQLFSENFTD